MNKIIKNARETLKIPTKITNENIKKYVNYYIENKEKLPWDLKVKQIGQWDVSRVTDMSDLFRGQLTFTESLNEWNVSNVTNMNRMFEDCYRFNSPLNKWNVSRVTNMGSMFQNCFHFNQPFFNEELNRTWDVSNVQNMGSMFMNCWDFNQPLNDWNVSNVLDMREMFKYCSDFNQPLNNWTINPEANTFEMFTSPRMLGINKPIMPMRRPIVAQAQVPIVTQAPRVDARQVHKEATKIKYDELNEFLSEKTNNSVVPSNLNYPNYINEKINSFIGKNAFIGESADIKRKQRNGLQRIMSERLNRFNYDNLSPSVRSSIFYCLNYVEMQSRLFQKAYVDSFIKDCVQAYEGAAGMTCVMGAVERIVFSLLPACAASENNPDCSTIVELIVGMEDDIKSYIREWYKLHKNAASDTTFPIDKRRANLKQYILTKLPSHEALIEKYIVKWADSIGYDDEYFDVSYGGRRRKTMKRIKRKKTMKRRISKKALKRRISKKARK